MPRQRRLVIPNCPHHITQRGNNRRDVFFSDGDRRVFLTLLKEYSRRYAVDILGYCLMTNHIHVLATPHTAEGLAKALGRTHNDYARWQNIRRRECGHMWQSRFYSCPVEARYLWAALAYVERNPVRAGLVSQCDDWRWSSARDHLDWGVAGSWLAMKEWTENWTCDLWRSALGEGLDETDLRSKLGEATETGRPLGGTGFIEDCEARSGLFLRRKKPGPKARMKGVGEEIASSDPRKSAVNSELW